MLVLLIEYSVCFYIKICLIIKFIKNLCLVVFDEWFIYMLVVFFFFFVKDYRINVNLFVKNFLIFCL